MRSQAFNSADLAFAGQDARPRGRKTRGLGFGWIAGAALVLVFGGFALQANLPAPGLQAARRNPTPAAAPQPVWVDILHPIQLFDLAAPELAKTSRLYAARRHRIGGGREDILTFGQLNGTGPYVRLRLYRVGAEAVTNVPLYVDLARTAAQADVSIRRSLTPAELPTRFGTFELVDVELAADAIPAVACLGFRGAALKGKFQIAGFACGGRGRPISRPALGCLIDRLDLNEAGDDQDLAAFFAESEFKRNPACIGTRLGPTATHASWLDENDAPPPLKGKKRI